MAPPASSFGARAAAASSSTSPSRTSTNYSGEMCCICLEQYHEVTSPPLRLSPCDHHVCRPCFNLLRRSSLGRRGITCPSCRAPVASSRVDMSILGNPSCGGGGPAAAAASPRRVPALAAGRHHEYIRDRSEFAFYGIDNSGSMGHTDGKTMLSHVPLTPASDFSEVVATAECRVRPRQSRWSELAESVKLVALYNLRRGIKSVYMILNPTGGSRAGVWRDGVDFVVVDASGAGGRGQAEAQLEVLFSVLLREDRVGGTTPLDRLTDEFRRKLSAMHAANRAAANELVSYTLFTDGLPDSKQRFEASLRFLAQECQLGSITVNLTTDEDTVLDYFNGLDTSLGAKTSALEGTRFDVLDDMAAEAAEVGGAGNRFLNYCLPVHVCRMAGCNSPVADELDERVLPPHYVAKLCKELVGAAGPSAATAAATMPHFGSDRAGFVAAVRARVGDMPEYWNLRARRRQPLLAVGQLDGYLRPGGRGLQGLLEGATGVTPQQLKRYLILAAVAVFLLAAFLMSSGGAQGGRGGYVPQQQGYRGR